MTLPRFTSGQVGRLDFSHLNDAFGYIDLQRGSESKPVDAADGKLPLVLAIIGSYDAQTKRHAWSEAVIDENGTAVPFTGGRTSTANGDPFAFPAFTPDGQQASAGSVVTLVPKRRKSGAIAYLVVSGSAAGTVNTLIVQGVQQVIHPQRMWVYQVRQAVWEFTPPFNWQATGALMYALNGCENAVDQPGVSIGVGTVVPVGVSASAIRQPIKSGTVVVATMVGSTWVFSVPNGYRYDCA